MEAFPFTKAEWNPLKGLALSVVNADSAEDAVLVASLQAELLARVDDLRERYGDHPVLLETAADYTDEPSEQVALYRRAVEIAAVNGLPTLSIRLSFASALVAFGEPVAALEELRACGGEAAGGSVDERKQWVEQLEDVARDAADDAQRAALFRRAQDIARGHGLPALRIRLGLVRFLLDVGDPTAARAELHLCQSEMLAGGEDDRAVWAALLSEADRAESPAPDTAT